MTDKKTYCEDISCLDLGELYWTWSQFPGFFFLDSSDRISSSGQFSWMGANPCITIRLYLDRTVISENGQQKEVGPDHNFILLNQYFERYTEHLDDPVVPFWGGWVGFWGYDAAGLLDDFSSLFSNKPKENPVAVFSLYDTVIAIDHQRDKKWIFTTSLEHQESDLKRKKESIDLLKKKPVSRLQDPKKEIAIENKPRKKKLRWSVTKNEYINQVKKCLKYIVNGDIYQVNLSHRFFVATDERPEMMYWQLRHHAAAPYSALLTWENGAILSTSPEQFIHRTGHKIVTRPIKGTRRRAQKPQDDEAVKKELLTAKKDEAELYMIVDLERNDLGKCCDVGTVKVSHLKEIESFSHVHHLVSTIEGKVKESVSVADIVAATFPGGSITGAPKRRAMEIISEMEKDPRSVYTGSLGFVGLDGQLNLNILIRTLYQHDYKKNGAEQGYYFHVGGGIVADSDPELEWKETLDKASGIAEGLGIQHEIEKLGEY